MLNRRDRINASVRKQQTKYIELPKDVEQALTLDAKNGNTSWTDAISKELENVKAAFKMLPYG